MNPAHRENRYAKKDHFACDDSIGSVDSTFHGVVHAGAVRTGTLELMAAAGEIKMEDFKVIHPIADDFPLVHSTPLYTEFPIAASSRVPQEIKDRVAEALFTLLPYDPASVAAPTKSPTEKNSSITCLLSIVFALSKLPPLQGCNEKEAWQMTHEI